MGTWKQSGLGLRVKGSRVRVRGVAFRDQLEEAAMEIDEVAIGDQKT